MSLADDTTRPFFLPVGLDFDSLPPELKAAFEQIVQPIYRRYVLQGNGLLEVAMGSSLSFLMGQEVLSQYAIGQDTFGCLKPTPEQSVLRQQEIDRYLRLLGAKVRCTDFLQRLAEFRNRKSFDPVKDL